jgi:transcription elongation factor GreA-like protein
MQVSNVVKVVVNRVTQGENMIIKRGTVVNHTGAIEWGVGKVMEVAAHKATIQFSDGITRKIASSHYTTLQPGDPDFFVPIPESVPSIKIRATPKRLKKIKEPAA